MHQTWLLWRQIQQRCYSKYLITIIFLCSHSSQKHKWLASSFWAYRRTDLSQDWIHCYISLHRPKPTKWLEYICYKVSQFLYKYKKILTPVITSYHVGKTPQGHDFSAVYLSWPCDSAEPRTPIEALPQPSRPLSLLHCVPVSSALWNMEPFCL